MEAWRKKKASGDVIVVRYADDLVVGFEHRAKVERFLKEFRERLEKFGLELHPEKTRLIRFGRFARQQRVERGEGEPETFAFLGFTQYCGTSSKGSLLLERRTIRKRMEANLQQVKQTLRIRMHESIARPGEWLGRVLNGFYQYNGIPGNRVRLDLFRERVSRYWWRALNRRSQQGRVAAARFHWLCQRWLPRPRFDSSYSRCPI